MRITTRPVAGAAAVAVAALVLAGCASGLAPEPSTGGSGGAAMPAFQGNFAAEYQEAWEKSGTDSVRGILEDEQITDQEWSQVLKTLETCLEDNGVSLTEYRADGSYEVNAGDMSGDVANERMGACEQESGEAWIGYLYRAQTSNPENIPATQLLTDCLIRNGAVPPSYTEEQYLVDAPDLAFPFVDEQGFATFESCNADFSFDG